MRKEYIRPITDAVESQMNEHLLQHSYDWADAKGNAGGVWGGSGHQVIENGHYKNDNGNDNLWDD